MCGQLNQQIVDYAVERMEAQLPGLDRRRLMGVGHRVAGRLLSAGENVETTFSLPGTVAGIGPRVLDLLPRIEAWISAGDCDHLVLFYSRQTSGASYRPRHVRLLPIDQAWLDNLKAKEWPTKALPLYTLDRNRLFSALLRQYLFISLFRAFADSLASENASRLASMQGAEKNIRDLLENLHNQYHQRRQMAITEELLDIVSGFEALESKDA
jgi:F-type H+-transporting ATPase subunit gamma